MSAGVLGGMVDAHAHVQAAQFDADRDEMLARARAAGLGAIVCAADDLAASLAALLLAEREPWIWTTAGIHPHEASGYDAATEEALAELAANSRVVAIGEIGLDYYRDLAPRDVQREVFEGQLQLAERLSLPVVIHSREAAEDTYAILRAWRHSRRAGAPGLMHCFGYDTAWAQRFLELGYFISIPGTVTFPNAQQTREVAQVVPDDRLTVETDCPYLAPQRWRGKRNEPAYLVETVARVAALRGIEPSYLGSLTAANAVALFALDGTGSRV